VTDDKPQPPVAWKTIARVADEANAADAADVGAVERLANLSDAVVDAELAAAGFSPDDAGKLLDDALATPARPAAPEAPDARVVVTGKVDRPRRPPPPSPWPVFALVAACALAVLLIWKRDDVSALLAPPSGDIGPDRPSPPKPEQLREAKRLRNEGLADCANGFWELCQDKLDHARAIDPAGDADPNVQAARKQAAAAVSATPLPLKGPKLR
jgi:hypothetical protein